MSDVLQDDLPAAALRDAGAWVIMLRPQSPHEVFQDALSVLKARLGPANWSQRLAYPDARSHGHREAAAIVGMPFTTATAFTGLSERFCF